MDYDRNVPLVIYWHFYLFREIQCALLVASLCDAATAADIVPKEKYADADTKKKSSWKYETIKFIFIMNRI